MSNDAMLKRAKELVVNYSFTRGQKWSRIKRISEAHAKASEQYDWWGQVVQEIGEEGEPYGLLQID